MVTSTFFCIPIVNPLKKHCWVNGVKMKEKELSVYKMGCRTEEWQESIGHLKNFFNFLMWKMHSLFALVDNYWSVDLYDVVAKKIRGVKTKQLSGKKCI